MGNKFVSVCGYMQILKWRILNEARFQVKVWALKSNLFHDKMERDLFLLRFLIFKGLFGSLAY